MHTSTLVYANSYMRQNSQLHAKDPELVCKSELAGLMQFDALITFSYLQLAECCLVGSHFNTGCFQSMEYMALTPQYEEVGRFYNLILYYTVFHLRKTQSPRLHTTQH